MKYKNIEYKECENVYPPAEDTFLLIDNLDVKKDDEVLEIGCGSGIVSIAASHKAGCVTCVDINPDAVKCTLDNIKLNNKNNITVFESDLFENITGRYDLIIFNTPYLPVVEEEYDINDDYSKAWDGGVDGRKVIDCFLKEVSLYLKKNGRIQLVQSSLSNNDKTLDYLNNNGFDASVTACCHQFFEDITLITASRK